MITKGIWAALAFAIALTTIMTGISVEAAKDDGPKGEPFQTIETEIVALQLKSEQVDSFFDVFFRDTEAGFDSFFDIFVDVGEERKVDSFFDIFTELHATDVELQEQIDGLVRPPTNLAGSEFFIKFAGVDGEAQDKDHKNWSNIVSFNQGQVRPILEDSSRSRGDVSFGDIVVVKQLDKASPKLAEAVVDGKVFPKVEIHVTASYTDAGRVTYYAYELKNVQVVSYNISGSAQSEDVPVEDFSLNFEEIKVTYTEVDHKGKSKGNVEYSWKVEEGES